ncbi:MAG: S16 family serine protease [Dictyoglomus sp.]
MTLSFQTRNLIFLDKKSLNPIWLPYKEIGKIKYKEKNKEVEGIFFLLTEFKDRQRITPSDMFNIAAPILFSVPMFNGMTYPEYVIKEIEQSGIFNKEVMDHTRKYVEKVTNTFIKLLLTSEICSIIKEAGCYDSTDPNSVHKYYIESVASMLNYDWYDSLKYWALANYPDFLISRYATTFSNYLPLSSYILYSLTFNEILELPINQKSESLIKSSKLPIFFYDNTYSIKTLGEKYHFYTRGYYREEERTYYKLEALLPIFMINGVTAPTLIDPRTPDSYFLKTFINNTIKSELDLLKYALRLQIGGMYLANLLILEGIKMAKQIYPDIEKEILSTIFAKPVTPSDVTKMSPEEIEKALRKLEDLLHIWDLSLWRGEIYTQKLADNFEYTSYVEVETRNAGSYKKLYYKHDYNEGELYLPRPLIREFLYNHLYRNPAWPKFYSNKFKQEEANNLLFDAISPIMLYLSMAFSLLPYESSPISTGMFLSTNNWVGVDRITINDVLFKEKTGWDNSFPFLLPIVTIKSYDLQDNDKRKNWIYKPVHPFLAGGVITIDPTNLLLATDIPKYLGPERYTYGMKGERDEIGVATGLAWTEAGGDILFVEALIVEGKGNLILTGKLGEVMQESAKTALSYVRSKLKELNINYELLEKSDIHVHVPSGAIPKDGPSAGVTIATAIASALTKRPVKKDIGMTGEITLRGKVLPVGGIREKVLAAHRAGLTSVIMPKENKKDLEEIPEEVKKDMTFYFVEHADEVLNLALLEVKEGAEQRNPERIG